MCEHKIFKAQVNVARLTESDESEVVTGYRADIEITCAECFMPFVFVGVPGGYSPGYPTVNVEGDELRVPIRPA